MNLNPALAKTGPRLFFKSLPFLFMGNFTHAAIVHPINESKVIEVGISHTDLTRITVKEDRILNVFGVTGEYVLEADESQGQVFIRPTSAFKPINLTLTTEKGMTQDLRLIPKDQPPEALILKENDILKDEVLKKRDQPPITREEIEDLFRACQEGRIPLRYKAVPLNLNTLKGPYSLIRELKGERLRALTYEVKNTSSIPLILSEPTFLHSSHAEKNDITAIWIEKKTLNSGEGTKVHVIAKS